MAISRSLMNRQLQANGGIMQVAPREKFGLGSKLKKFVRKIIPNEVAEIATKAAPFVAPFNPAIAAAMSGIGTFDQTGSIGDSLKGGALTYGLGQGARYLGGAGFQGNPFQAGGAFTGSGFKGGFTTPFGTDTGIGQMLSENFKKQGQVLNKQLEGIKGVGIDTTVPLKKPDIVSPGGSVMDSFKSIVSFDTSPTEKTNAAFDLLKRGSKAVFTKPDGKGGTMIDRAAVMGAVTAAASYAEALALAKDTGVEITEEEYDEAKKADKQEEYAGYLQNFFGGKKDGGRIGFESGANEMIKTQLLGEIMPETTTEDFIIIMTEDGPVRVKKSDMEEMPGMFRDTTTGEGSNMFTRIGEADGGRIGLARGSKPEEAEVGIMTIDVEAGDDDEEDMMMAYSDAIFNRREKAALFRALGDPRIQQTTGSFKDLNNLLKNPGMFPERELMLKEYLKIKGYADGGRIGFNEGADLEQRLKDLADYYMERGLSESEAYETAANELYKADGGRIGYKGGANRVSELLILRDELIGKGEDVSDIEAEIFQLTGKTFKSVGGISDVPTGKMRKNNAGVTERDYRDEGGFVPVGIKERADDVPAMLSKNEFVMTADAVRGIGNGSVEEGSKKLYNTMKKAEQVGKA